MPIGVLSSYWLILVRLVTNLRLPNEPNIRKSQGG